MAKDVIESVIKPELDFLERQLDKMNKYLEDNPPDLADDRTEIIPTAKGVPIIKVIANKEQQVKMFLSVLKDYMNLLPELKKLREENATQNVETRAGSEFNGLMRKNFKTDSE